jgi:WD40 repeat protein
MRFVVAINRRRIEPVGRPCASRLLGQRLTSGTEAVYAVAFGPGGRTLASGSIDGAVRLWNPNVTYASERICTTAGGLTHQQWQAYISQLPYQALCAQCSDVVPDVHG